jgi:integrase
VRAVRSLLRSAHGTTFLQTPLNACSGVCGFHAFRHGNETVMDGEGVPMATRQNRLGHSDARTTMRYTHVISEDGRKIAARFGELLTCSPTAAIMPAGNK